MRPLHHLWGYNRETVIRPDRVIYAHLDATRNPLPQGQEGSTQKSAKLAPRLLASFFCLILVRDSVL